MVKNKKIEYSAQMLFYHVPKNMLNVFNIRSSFLKNETAKELAQFSLILPVELSSAAG